jgi:AcrR family transcriptional regulator
MADVKSTRRAKSLATRHKILDAAESEFAASGYHGATIASIARRAGVATQTVYFVFHTKAELISAAIERLVMGDDDAEPQDRDWWRAMRAEPDAATALQLFVTGAAPLFQRASGLSEILRGAALTDDELRSTHEHHERLREIGFREVVEMLTTKGRLRSGLDVGTATDVLLVEFSDASYVLLTVDRGWSHEQAVEYYCEALPLVLLAAPGAVPSG